MAVILTAQHLLGQRIMKIKPLPEKTMKNVHTLIAKFLYRQNRCCHWEQRGQTLLASIRILYEQR